MENNNEIMITPDPEIAVQERYEPPKLQRPSSAMYMMGSSFLPVFVRASCRDFERFSSYMDVKKVVHTEDSVSQEKLTFPTVKSWIKIWKQISGWAVLCCENGHFFSLETCMGIVKNDTMTRAKCPSCRSKIKITDDISSMVCIFKELHQEVERQEGQQKKTPATSEGDQSTDEDDDEDDSDFDPEDEEDTEEENEFGFDEEETDEDDDEEGDNPVPIMMRLVTRRRGSGRNH
jgi:hypothetical protein